MQSVDRTFRADLHRLSQVREHWRGHDEALNDLYQHPGGGVDLYIVSGDSIFWAVSMTYRLIVKGGWSKSEPAVLSAGDHEPPLWLVVHLGRGSGTPMKELAEVTIEGNDIVVRHRRLHPPARTADVQHYIYWVPIERLEPGTHTLTLWDMDRDDFSVTRRVQVK